MEHLFFIGKQLLDWCSDKTGLRAVPDLWQGRKDFNTTKLRLRSFCQTNSYCCGVTAGWTVLSAFDNKASFEDFYAVCSPTPDFGMSMPQLGRALRKSGVTVKTLRSGNFQTVVDSIDNGWPLVVSTSHTNPHFVVIYGYGESPNRVFLCNETRLFFGRSTMKWSEFVTVWNPKGQALLCKHSNPLPLLTGN